MHTSIRAPRQVCRHTSSGRQQRIAVILILRGNCCTVDPARLLRKTFSSDGFVHIFHNITGHSGSHLSAGNTGLSGGVGASAGLVGLSSGFLSSRRTSLAEGSGRSSQAADEAIELRSRHLNQRIDEIMEQADVNKDGVIR
jgi:hypothetical protein